MENTLLGGCNLICIKTRSSKSHNVPAVHAKEKKKNRIFRNSAVEEIPAEHVETFFQGYSFITF